MDKVRFASAFTCFYVCKKPCQDKSADCTITRYCSRSHQLKDWKKHRVICGWLWLEQARPAPSRDAGGDPAAAAEGQD